MYSWNLIRFKRRQRKRNRSGYLLHAVYTIEYSRVNRFGCCCGGAVRGQNDKLPFQIDIEKVNISGLGAINITHNIHRRRPTMQYSETSFIYERINQSA